MLEWTENKPTEPGWYIWFRAEYDQFRREFFIVGWPEGKDHTPDNLRVFPANRHLDYIVGGVWYGPIPRPPLEGAEQGD